jgi:hypothetical protein
VQDDDTPNEVGDRRAVRQIELQTIGPQSLPVRCKKASANEHGSLYVLANQIRYNH